MAIHEAAHLWCDAFVRIAGCVPEITMARSVFGVRRLGMRSVADLGVCVPTRHNLKCLVSVASHALAFGVIVHHCTASHGTLECHVLANARQIRREPEENPTRIRPESDANLTREN